MQVNCKLYTTYLASLDGPQIRPGLDTSCSKTYLECLNVWCKGMRDDDVEVSLAGGGIVEVVALVLLGYCRGKSLC